MSATKRMVITSYGSSREKPIIRDCVKPAMFVLNKAANYVTVKNVHFYRSHLSFLGPMKDFRIQDCILEQGGVSCNSYAGEVRDFKMIRCAVIDAYSTRSHAQGAYFKAVNGLTIDKCLFDHNGWNEEVEGAERTMFNHNIYIQNGNKNVSVTNSIVSRGSSQGVMMRSGGVLTGNLFVRNAISASIGGGFADEAHLGEGVVNEGVTATVTGNVIIESDGRANGWGLLFSNIKSAEVSDNIIANDISVGTGCGIYLFGSQQGFDYRSDNYVGVLGFNASGNIIYNHGYNMRISGTLYDAVFFDNTFQSKGSAHLLYYMIDSLSCDDANLSFDGNDWHSERTDKWVKAKPVTVSFDAFADSHGEEIAEELQFHDPVRNVELYCLEVLGRELTYDEFIEEAVANWGRYAYSAAAINEYIREGFEAAL